jgi:hypothetical protein
MHRILPCGVGEKTTPYSTEFLSYFSLKTAKLREFLGKFEQSYQRKLLIYMVKLSNSRTCKNASKSLEG